MGGEKLDFDGENFVRNEIDKGGRAVLFKRALMFGLNTIEGRVEDAEGVARNLLAVYKDSILFGYRLDVFET